MMYGYGGHWFGMGGGWIIGLLFLIVVIWLLIRATGSNQQLHRPSNSSHQGGNSAVDILKERYARGEIDKEEFEQKKKDLQ